MTPTEVLVWAGGAIGLTAVAWAFFKSDSLRVRLGTLGAFGVFYISMLVLEWGDAAWFNATTFGVVIIALVSRRQNPGAKKTDEPEPVEGEDRSAP